MIRKLALIGAISASMLALGGCDPSPADPSSGGGGGGGGATVTLAGTAAIGALVTNGNVEARGANNQTATGTTGTDGRYSLNVAGLTNPIMVMVSGGNVDDDGAGPNPATANTTNLFSVSTATGSSRTANVTSLTTLALQNAVGNSDLSGTFGNWATASARPSTTAINDAAARVRANLASAATAISGWSTYNFFTAPFPAVGTGVDALMDAVTCTASGTPTTTYTVSCTGGITYNLTISTAGFTTGGSTGGTGGTTFTSVPASSQWTYSIGGTVNGVAIPANSTTVAGSTVPMTSTAFNTLGRAYAQTGTVSGGGITVSFNIGTLTLNKSGDGSVGSTVTGTMNGSMRVSGTVQGFPINTTTNFQYTFTWTRTS